MLMCSEAWEMYMCKSAPFEKGEVIRFPSLMKHETAYKSYACPRCDRKSKRFSLFTCFGKRRETKWILESPETVYEPMESNTYVKTEGINPFLDGYNLDKSRQINVQNQTTEDKATQIPDIILTTPISLQNLQKEGVVRLSLPDSNNEPILFESFLEREAVFAKIFENHGLRLQAIEKGSIIFKFTIPSRECDSAAVMSEGNLQNLVSCICKEALQSIPEGRNLEDVSIEVIFSSHESAQYIINATAVQLGNNNNINLESTDVKSSMYIIPIPPDNDQQTDGVYKNVGSEAVASKSNPNAGLCQPDDEYDKTLTASDNDEKSPLACKQRPADSAYGSGCAEIRGQETDELNKNSGSEVIASETNSIMEQSQPGSDQQTDELNKNSGSEVIASKTNSSMEHSQPGSDEETEDVYKSSSETNSSETYPIMEQRQAEGHQQMSHHAYISFKAQDKEGMDRIMYELCALKSLSFLEFDIKGDPATCTATMCIFRRCVTLKDFYTNVLQFSTYPHLLCAIKCNMIDVTIELHPDNRHPEPVITTQQPYDVSICFQAQNQQGMNAVMNELEPLKAISSLEFEIENSTFCCTVTMVIQRTTSTPAKFFESVLHFLTYVHLMKAVTVNTLDVKIHVSAAAIASATGNVPTGANEPAAVNADVPDVENDDNVVLYDTCSLRTLSSVWTSVGRRSLSVQDKPAVCPKLRQKRKRSGFTQFFSSLRQSIGRRGET